MARDDYVHHRLEMWALWRARMSGGGGNLASVALDQEKVDRSAGWDASAVIDNIDAEAEETDRAVQTLSADQRGAVVACYCQGGTVDAKARRCGCSPATYYARVEQAQRAISRWLSEQTEMRLRERDRVEQLQRSLAPVDRSATPSADDPAGSGASAPDKPSTPLSDWLARLRRARGVFTP